MVEKVLRANTREHLFLNLTTTTSRINNLKSFYSVSFSLILYLPIYLSLGAFRKLSNTHLSYGLWNSLLIKTTLHIYT